MGTPAIVGTINSEGEFKGRYVHRDGYPTAFGKNLATLIDREGVDHTLDVLTEKHYGWSQIDPATPNITDVKPNQNAKNGTAEYQAWLFDGGVYRDGRFVNVPGFGVAYTTKDGQSRPDDWIAGTLNVSAVEARKNGFPTMSADWGYLVDRDAGTLTVANFNRCTVLPLGTLSEANWDAITFGEV